MALKLEQKPTLSVTRTANAAITTPNRFVIEVSGTPENVKVADTANTDVLGVVDRKYNQNDPAEVQTQGILVVEAGAAVAVGDLVVTDNVGRGVPKAAVATTHYKVFGRALTAAGAAGNLFSLLVDRHDFYQQ